MGPLELALMVSWGLAAAGIGWYMASVARAVP